MPFITQGKTNWRYIFIVVILAAIVGGGILWFLQQQIPSYQPLEIKIPEKIKDETADTSTSSVQDWQTYRNEEYGFEIKYPKFFKNTFSHEEMYFDFQESIFNPNYEENPFGETGGFQFEKKKNNHEDWIEFVKRQYAHVYSAEPEKDYAYGLKVVEFQGLKSIQFYAKNGYGEDGEGEGFAFAGPEILKIIYFEKDGYVWRLMLPDTSIYNQMLSTFRFIELDETADWKTYRNAGISLKYPPNSQYSGEGQINFIQKEETVPATLCSFLTFTPAADSLENYLKFYADKLGKKIISKEIKTFGDAKEGILYTIELTSRYKEMGYIFSNGSFTYHFWRNDTHTWTSKPESIDLFLKTLSTLKLITPLAEIPIQEIDNQRIYKSENYGIEFKYPTEWGSLALQSIRNDTGDNKIYRFATAGESDFTLYYHQPSGMIALIMEGEKYDLAYGGGSRQDILQVYKDKKIKTIYSVSPEAVSWYGEIGSINLSPHGKYIYFTIYGYESYDCMMVNIDSGLNITDCDTIRYSPYEDVYWSPNNKVLAIRSEHSDFGGEGVDGLFVSDYDNPEKLNEVFSFTWEKHISGSDIYDIRFVDDYKLFFTVLSKECSYEEELVCKPERITTYEYNVKTRKLEEVKE